MNFQALYEQRLAELAQQQGSANGNGANGDSGIILPPARPASNADPLNPRDRPMTASASPSLRVAVLGAGSWGLAAAAAATVLWHATPPRRPTSRPGGKTNATCPAFPCRRHCNIPATSTPRSPACDRTAAPA